MRRQLTAGLLVVLAAAWSAGAAAGEQAAQASSRQVPAGKETVPGLSLTAKEAYDKWKAEPEKVKILDVRTPEEYLFVGHPAMAWNIPLLVQTYQWDAGKRTLPMKPNPDFISRVNEVFKPTDTILVICRSGGRSAQAVNQLAEIGFRNVYSIVDGMEGDTVADPASVFDGKRMKNGWKNSGLPWTCDVDPDRMLLPANPK